MEGEAEFIFNKLWGEVDRHVCKDAKQLKESTHQRGREIGPGFSIRLCGFRGDANVNWLNTFQRERGRELALGALRRT